jgi:uncharacterized membrane protein
MEGKMTQQPATKEDGVNKEETPTAEVKKKSTFWGKFANFLMMGGFLVVLVLGVVLVVAISVLFKCK